MNCDQALATPWRVTYRRATPPVSYKKAASLPMSGSIWSRSARKVGAPDRDGASAHALDDGRVDRNNRAAALNSRAP